MTSALYKFVVVRIRIRIRIRILEDGSLLIDDAQGI